MSSRFRFLLLLCCAAQAALAGEHRLYATGVTTKGYVVGAPLQMSGLFLRTGDGEWVEKGFTNPAVLAVDYDRSDPSTLYLAIGNGCFEAKNHGDTWKQLTGWRVTELQDVSLDPNRPGRIYIALPDGVGFSPDGGKTWTHRTPVTRRKYFHNVVVDSAQAGRVIAGGETGLFLSENEGGKWMFVGGNDAQITQLTQSTKNPRHWAASSQDGGLLLSTDGGGTLRQADSLDSRQTIYNADFDPHNAQRIAAAGWGIGVAISDDGGRTWHDRTHGLPIRRIWRVAFDPDRPNRIYAAVHEQGLYVSDDLGFSWKFDGLEGSLLRELRFVPEAE